MRALLVLWCALGLVGCKKEASATAAPSSSAAAPAPDKVLAPRLLGRWNDAEDGTLAWEFLPGGKCKAFGNMECEYQPGAESGSVLELRYKATSSWEDIQVTFEGVDSASWKNLTEAKTDPEATPMKLARAKSPP